MRGSGQVKALYQAKEIQGELKITTGPILSAAISSISPVSYSEIEVSEPNICPERSYATTANSAIINFKTFMKSDSNFRNFRKIAIFFFYFDKINKNSTVEINKVC